MEPMSTTTAHGDGGQISRAVSFRLRGYTEAAAHHAAELRSMTDEDARAAAGELAQLLSLLPDEPDHGSGLVEQQRIFARLRG
jgi:hypothetical protein